MKEEWIMKAAPNRIKTSILLDKTLLEEIDLYNPFPSRDKFLDQACKAYLRELRRKIIDGRLAEACLDAAEEDISVSKEWEYTAMEGWE
jgi:hypothetical protein